MADKLLTLLELTKRAGTDAAVGLVNEVNTVAPELAEIKGRVIAATTYKVRKRIANPKNSSGTGPAFRNVNEGSDILSGVYDQLLGQCFFFDGQMRVDEALVKDRVAEGDTFGDVLADEAAGFMHEQAIRLGDQFYRGTTADTKGFVGLKDSYDTTNCELDLAGTGGAYSSAYLIWNNVQGVHFVFGGGSGMALGQWVKQQVEDADSKKFMAYVNNGSAYIGLAVNHTKSIVRAKKITAAAPLTDQSVARMLAKLPIFIRNDRANLKLMVNTSTLLGLQLSRSTPPNAKTDSAILQTAPTPTESLGIPIILTDSLPTNETA